MLQGYQQQHQNFYEENKTKIKKSYNYRKLE